MCYILIVETEYKKLRAKHMSLKGICKLMYKAIVDWYL